MNEQNDKLTSLRKRAEALLQEGNHSRTTNSHDLQELIHELNVHRVELEIQLEDLQHSNAELLTVQERYASLFHDARVPYVITDPASMILEANASAGNLFGLHQWSLVGRRLAEFV